MEDSQSEHELEERRPLRHFEHARSNHHNFDSGRAQSANINDTKSKSSILEEDISGSGRFARIGDLATWIPDAAKPANWITQRAIMLCIHMALSTAVLLLNIGFAASSMWNFQMDTYTGQYFAGSCSSVKVANRWIHLGINVLSSLLLLSSNYCMQILMAPTREEVDRAHKNHDWFDIGVQSWRNWRRIALKRRIVCVVLMVSSGLLHLSWNSAVFSATPVSYYRVAVVTSDFESDPNPWRNNSWTGQNLTPHIQQMRYNISGLDRLNKTECFDRHISSPVGMGDLIVVSSNVTMADNQSVVSNTTSSLLDITRTARGTNWIMYNFWMCNRWKDIETKIPKDWCTRDFLEPHLDEWVWKGWKWTTPSQTKYLYSWYYKIDYCLSDGDNSKEMEQHCALQFSSIVLIVVCVLNAIKCLCILYTAQIQWQSTIVSTSGSDGKPRESKVTKLIRPFVPKNLENWFDGVSRTKRELRENPKRLSLVTVGDAVASFLEDEDIHTRGMEMASISDFLTRWPEKEKDFQVPKKTTWFQSASLRKWYLTYGLISLMAIITVPILALELYNLAQAGIPIDLGSLLHQGLGSFNPYAYVFPQVIGRLSKLGQYFLSTFIANVFQVILSFFYIVYNSLITTLLIADEWNRFIHTRKSVRVSSPRSLQRSSYFLSLPLKYSVPLNIINTLLHWLVSQCFFVIASVEYVTPHFTHDKNSDSFIIGFSTIAIVLAIPAGVVLFLSPLPLAYIWKLEAPMRGEDEEEEKGGDEGGETSEDEDNATNSKTENSAGSTPSSSMVISMPAARSDMNPNSDMTSKLLPNSTVSRPLKSRFQKKHTKSTYPMPLASTCSAAISAACHRHKDDDHAHLLPITWGFVRDREDAGQSRFCFTTARDVEWPSNDDLSKMRGKQFSDGEGV